MCTLRKEPKREKNTQDRPGGSNTKEPKQNAINIIRCLSISGHATLGVGNLDAQSLGLGQDVDALPGGNGVTDLSSVGAVVHQEELDVGNVLDEESLVAGRGHVAGLLVGTVSNLSDAGESAKAVLKTFPFP